MREELLHFIWKYKKFNGTKLMTSNHQSVVIVDLGLHNQLSGPDFFNSRLNIGGQLWAGNVEIHIKASDWYAHKHEQDDAYDNVILHVVWEDDATVFRKDGSEIPTLILKNYISTNIVKSSETLFDKKQKAFINCEKDLTQVDSFIIQNWKERLFIERLERKSQFIFKLLKASKNDWEQVLFKLLAKNFGLKINGEAFLSLANAIDFSVIRKMHGNVLQLESIFYGMSHLLTNETIPDTYYLQLNNEYQFIIRKHNLHNKAVLKPEFFKLRPANFPTIRLSQLANLYSKHQNLFQKLIHVKHVNEIYNVLNVGASAYWNDHYTFGKTSKKTSKKITNTFIDLLVINTIIPLQFCYAKHYGKDIDENLVQLASELKTEKNAILTAYKKHGMPSKNAKESQALLQLYTEYCTKNKCLSCAIGNTLIQS